jgi:hypothetical protein
VGEVDPEASARKLRAKRTNERVKLTTVSLNTLALAIVGAAFVIPGVTSLENVRWAWIPSALSYICWRILCSAL